MSDYVVASAAWMLDQQVNTRDEAGNLLPDDGAYQRRGAEKVWVFGEFMRDRGMLRDGVEVSRSREFQLRNSDLTDEGQAFTRAHFDKWVRSLDRQGVNAIVDATKLEKRLAAFRKGGG